MELFLFYPILENPSVSALLRFKESGNEADYVKAMQGLLQYTKFRITDGNILKEYLLHLMLEQEEIPDINNLRNFLRHDVKLIYQAFWDYDWDELAHNCGLPTLSDIETPPRSDVPADYVLSIRSIMDCTSNEALGGAILAHAEAFSKPPIKRR